MAHALVVMAHFHSLSSFALGCGLTPEIDTSQEFMTMEGRGAEFTSNPSPTLTNPALGVGRQRENSESDTPQTDSEPITPDFPSSPPTDSRTGQYMVHYFLNCKE